VRPLLIAGALLLGGGVLAAAVRGWWNHGVAVGRLGRGESEGDEEETPRAARRPIRRPRRGIISLAVGVACAAGLVLGLGLSMALGLSIGILAFLVSRVVEEHVERQSVLRIETHLAEAIDMTVSALAAGASPADALDRAARECPSPLRGYFVDLVERLRLGEPPAVALEEFERRLPLMSVRTLRFALAAHWEGGGAIAATLASVARSTRDRTALVRRVQAQSAEAQASVVGVLLVTYALALVMWRSDPERIQGFLDSEIGSWFVPAAVLLQVVGLGWMTRITRVEL